MFGRVQLFSQTTKFNLFFQLDNLGGLHPTSFRGRCFRLCHNKYWDLAIAFVICVNVILMSLEHYRMSENYKLLLDVNNYVCTGIFIIEAFVKLTAVGWRCYFYNRYDDWLFNPKTKLTFKTSSCAFVAGRPGFNPWSDLYSRS